MTAQGNLVAAPKVAERFDISNRTLARWIRDTELRFPQPVKINGRLYFPEGSINAWQSARADLAMREAA